MKIDWKAAARRFAHDRSAWHRIAEEWCRHYSRLSRAEAELRRDRNELRLRLAKAEDAARLASKDKVLELLRRVAAFRVNIYLFPEKAEDELAGMRQDAATLLERIDR